MSQEVQDIEEQPCKRGGRCVVSGGVGGWGGIRGASRTEIPREGQGLEAPGPGRLVPKAWVESYW